MIFPRCPHCNAEVDPAKVMDGACTACHKPVPFGRKAEATIFSPTRAAPNIDVSAPSATLLDPASSTGDLADRGSRLAARLADWMLIVIAWVPGWFLMQRNAPAHVEDPFSPLFVVGLGLFFLLPLALEIIQIVLIATTGQTIGKKLLKIRVVTHDFGELPGFWSGYVLRYVLPALLLAVLMLGICLAFHVYFPWMIFVDYLFIFTADKRCLHDRLAGTIVVQA